MNYIKKPDPVVLDAQTKFSIDDFIMYFINVCDVFNRSGNGIRSSIRIENAVKASKDRDLIELESNDYESLKEVVKEPPGDVQYPIKPARLLISFIDAIENAK